MISTKDEIFMVKQEIIRKREELERIDRKDPNNRFKFANIRSEINVLNQKLDDLNQKLQEEYKKESYVPTIGDERYAKFPHKAVLDTLRISYYEKFGTDPSITYIGDTPMFVDDSLSIYADAYNIRGKMPFKLKFDSKDYRLEKDSKASILAEVSKNDFFVNDSNKYIELIVDFIKKYTDNSVNFIYTDGLLKNIHFARIDDGAFRSINGKKDFYLFFHDFFDNLYRNVIYIGDSMKDGVKASEQEEVTEELIIPSQQMIAKKNEKTIEELNAFNEEVKKKILAHNK